jgi:hypothetical protein
MRGVFIVKVLDRAHQVPLAVERQCRPRTSGVENLDCDPRRQRQILQTDADLGQAFATLESFAVFGARVLNRDSSVNAVILEQPIDDRDVAVFSSPIARRSCCRPTDRRARLAAVVRRRRGGLSEQPSTASCRWPTDRRACLAAVGRRPRGGRSQQPIARVVVVGRRIDALVLQQSFDDCEVAVLSSQ